MTKAPSCHTYQLLASTPCRHFGSDCLHGYNLMRNLQKAVSGGAVGPDFQMSGVVHTQDCHRPCSLAYEVSQTSVFVFGGTRSSADFTSLKASVVQRQGLDQYRGLFGDISTESCAPEIDQPSAILISAITGTPMC